MDFLNQLDKELEFLKGLKDRLDMIEMFKGELIKRPGKGGARYYYRRKIRNEKGEYVYKVSPLKDADRIAQLKAQRYYKELNKKVTRNIKLLERIRFQYLSYDSESIEMRLPAAYTQETGERRADALQNEVKRQNVLTSEQLQDWQEGLYSRNGRTIDLPQFNISGKALRSKSEVLISNLLEAYKIPYRIEERLELIDESRVRHVRYPDFTILLPDGKEVYWEHFGLMDRKDYVGSMSDKLYLYALNGIRLGDNLIITSDGRGGTIDMEYIRRLLENMIIYEYK